MRPGINPKVLGDLLDERALQDAQWGGPAHDDQHGFQDWGGIIQKHLYGGLIEPTTARTALVKVAALAIAAIESHDRQPEAWATYAADVLRVTQERREKRRADLANMDPFERRYGEQPPDDR